MWYWKIINSSVVEIKIAVPAKSKQNIFVIQIIVYECEFRSLFVGGWWVIVTCSCIFVIVTYEKSVPFGKTISVRHILCIFVHWVWFWIRSFESLLVITTVMIVTVMIDVVVLNSMIILHCLTIFTILRFTSPFCPRSHTCTPPSTSLSMTN